MLFSHQEIFGAPYLKWFCLFLSPWNSSEFCFVLFFDEVLITIPWYFIFLFLNSLFPSSIPLRMQALRRDVCPFIFHQHDLSAPEGLPGNKGIYGRCLLDSLIPPLDGHFRCFLLLLLLLQKRCPKYPCRYSNVAVKSLWHVPVSDIAGWEGTTFQILCNWFRVSWAHQGLAIEKECREEPS